MDRVLADFLGVIILGVLVLALFVLGLAPHRFGGDAAWDERERTDRR